MHKKNIIRLLGTLDEQEAAKLSEQHLVLSEKEHERILQKIETRTQKTETAPAEIPRSAPIRTSRLEWLTHAATAAACIAVFGGAFAGIVWLKNHAPAAHEDFTQTSVPDALISAPTNAYSIGETYAVPNLVSRGELQITVQSAGYSEETGLYEVTLGLWSEGARAHDGSVLFYADNFLVAVGEQDGLWDIVSPCAAEGTWEESPYRFRMEQHNGRTLTLSYDLNEKKPLALVTNRQKGFPYTNLTEE